MNGLVFVIKVSKFDAYVKFIQEIFKIIQIMKTDIELCSMTTYFIYIKKAKFVISGDIIWQMHL